MSSAEAPPTFDLFQRFVSHVRGAEIKLKYNNLVWNKTETNFVLFQFYFSFISHV